RAMPRPERTGKDRHRVGGAIERYGAGDAWAKAIGVRPPLELQDLSDRRAWRQNRVAWRHDEIGLRTDPLTPSAHRLDDQRAIEQALRRSLVIDHGSIHFQHRQRANPCSGANAFAAEIVVALDDHVRLEALRDRSDGTGVRPPQFLPS